MPYNRNLVHIVWSTKYRNPDLANDKRRKELFLHIMEAAGEMNIQLIQIGGMSEHIHCLINLDPTS